MIINVDLGRLGHIEPEQVRMLESVRIDSDPRPSKHGMSTLVNHDATADLSIEQIIKLGELFKVAIDGIGIILEDRF
jgi:hypothetical protein